MKVSDLMSKFEGFRESQCSGKGLGCEVDIVIKDQTIETGSDSDGAADIRYCSEENLVESHSQHLDEVIERMKSRIPDCVEYLRTPPKIKAMLNDEGEVEGYVIRTRLQFGEKSKCITMEQFNHLQSLN